MHIEPLVLEGEYVQLEPFSVEDHLAALQDAGSDPDIFRWSDDQIETPEDMREYVEEALAAQEGIHRQRMITHQGLRDSVFYSVLDTEWPTVRRDLEAKLEWPRSD